METSMRFYVVFGSGIIRGHRPDIFTMPSSRENQVEQLSYRDSGVDIDAGNSLVDRIKPAVKRTTRPEVLHGLGGFGALIEIPVERFRKPVLVSGTDGVGTKLKLAGEIGDHSTVGIDLVAMCVNDIVVSGAEPLYFLDYLATSSLDVDQAEQVITGIARGCELAGCALTGGETAEMPGMYNPGEYDLAGFAVGIVEKDAMLNPENVSEGDTVIGLASSGVHSNGYSLVRKIIDRSGSRLDYEFGGSTLGKVLLEPTRIYVKSILNLLAATRVTAIAHITGGGLLENIPRVLPSTLGVRLDQQAWDRPEIFSWLQANGNVADMEMLRTFNCGIGMIVCVPAREAETALKSLRNSGEQAWIIGTVTPESPARVSLA